MGLDIEIGFDEQVGMVWEELADVDSCCERGCVSFHKAPSWRKAPSLVIKAPWVRRNLQTLIVVVIGAVCTRHHLLEFELNWVKIYSNSFVSVVDWDRQVGMAYSICLVEECNTFERQEITFDTSSTKA